MTAPTATVTGPIFDGNGALLASGTVIFTRARWDDVDGSLVVKSVIRASVVGGAMSQALALTTGDAGVLWYATLIYIDHVTGATITDSFGRFALTTTDTSVAIIDLIGADDAPESTQADALAQCLAAAAQTALDRVATGEDRDLAQAWAEGTLPGGAGTKSAKEWASDAEGSASAATAAQALTEAVLDSFDDRYLGVKTSEPAADNDGNALVAGAICFNSSTNLMMIYNGSSWQILGSDIGLSLLKTNNLSDLPNATTACNNLGFSTFFQTLIGSADLAAIWSLLCLGNAAAQGFTDDDDLSVNPDDVGTRGNMAAAIAANSPLAFESAPIPLNSSNEITAAHGLGVAPSLVTYSLVCTSNDAGFSVGDRIYDIFYEKDFSSDNSTTTWGNATECGFSIDDTGGILCANKSGSSSSVLNQASWSIILRAWV